MNLTRTRYFLQSKAREARRSSVFRRASQTLKSSDSLSAIASNLTGSINMWAPRITSGFWVDGCGMAQRGVIGDWEMLVFS